jgi:hypothetical protein
MRLDEYQIANALIDTRLVMTSRHGARIWGKGSNGMEYPSPFINPSPASSREADIRPVVVYSSTSE